MLNMALHAINVFSEDEADTERLFHGDRRNRLRVVVHWPLIFRSQSGGLSEAITHDLSSQGLYFHSDQPSVVGELLYGTLMVPAYHPENPTQVIPVNCTLRVLRVEALAANRFGIGCHIEEYHVDSGVGCSTLRACPGPNPEAAAC